MYIVDNKSDPTEDTVTPVTPVSMRKNPMVAEMDTMKVLPVNYEPGDGAAKAPWSSDQWSTTM